MGKEKAKKEAVKKSERKPKKASETKKPKKSAGEKKGKREKSIKAAARKLTICPCCSKHCSLAKPKCSKGKAIAKKMGV